MLNNEVKIKGRSYRYNLSYTKSGKPVSTFGLQIYNGKDSEGKSKYAFVNCKCFNDLKLQDKQDVSIDGHIAVEEWKDKLGKNQSRTLIIVDKLDIGGSIEQRQESVFEDDESPL